MALADLRKGRGLLVEELAARSGRSRSLITRWETEKEPSWESLVELAVDVMQYDLEEVEALVYGLSRALGLAAAPETPLPMSEDDLREVRRVTGPVGRAATDSLEEHLLGVLRAKKLQEARKVAAEEICATLLRAAPPMRRLYIESQAAFRTWMVAERLCELSAQAAARSDGRSALDLAQLADRVAELLTGEETWRARVRGYCLAFVANAWRVLRELEKAAEIFLRALELWDQGEEGDPERILPEWRLLDLEASLRRDQRRLAEALDLHGRARAATLDTPPQILLNEAVTHDRMFKPERVIEVLREAAPQIDAKGGPRLRFRAGCLLVDSLCRLGQYQEAEGALHETRNHAIALRDASELQQVQWLTGRVAAGLGQVAPALEAFRAVRRRFEAERLAYAYALASLEEAGLLLDLGLSAQVREMVVHEMSWIYAGAAAIHEEAMAALKLFRGEVEAGRAMAKLARRVHEYLVRAENDPDHRFDGLRGRPPRERTSTLA